MRKNSFIKFIKKLFSKMGLTIMTALLLCAVGLGTGIGLSLRNNTSQSIPTVESGVTSVNWDWTSQSYIVVTRGNYQILKIKVLNLNNDSTEIVVQRLDNHATDTNAMNSEVYFCCNGYWGRSGTVYHDSNGTNNATNGYKIQNIVLKTLMGESTLKEMKGEFTIDYYVQGKSFGIHYYSYYSDYYASTYSSKNNPHALNTYKFYRDTTTPTLIGATGEYYKSGDAVSVGCYAQYSLASLIINKNNNDISSVKTSKAGDTATSSLSITDSTTNGSYSVLGVNSVGSQAVLGSGYSTFYVDTQKPTISASSGGKTLSSGGKTNSSVELTANDPEKNSYSSGISKIQYKKTSASSWSTYSSAISTEGTYVARALDKAGNYSAEVTFTIDKTSPTITPSGGITSNSTSTNYMKTSVTLKVSDTSSSSTLYYGTNTSSLSSKTASAGSSSSVTISTDGTYYYYAVDAAGNRRPSSGYYTFTIDTTVDITAPTITPSGGIEYNSIDTNYTNTSVTLDFTDTLYYGTDTSSLTADTTGSVTISAEGIYYYYAEDDAGNRTPSDEETYYTFTLARLTFNGTADGAGNSLLRGGSTAYGWTISTGNFSSLSGIDSLQYTTDNGTTWTEVSSFHTVNYYDVNGTYVYKCTDNAGNTTTAGFILDSDSWTSDSSRYENPTRSGMYMLVSTPAQLAGLAHLINSGTRISSRIRLTANIDMSAHKWVPIGLDSSYPFTGRFFGAGYTISGLNTYDEALIDNVGLFGYVDGGTINNVTVKDSTLIGLEKVGGIVGCADSSTIANCTFSGNVSGMVNVGGIAGELNNTSDILNCIVNGSTVRGDENVGGIAGYLYKAEIEGCTVSGIVYGANSAGGIVGVVYISSITNCIVNGSISGMYNIGGIVGSTPNPYLRASGTSSITLSLDTITVGGSVNSTVSGSAQNIGIGALIGYMFARDSLNIVDVNICVTSNKEIPVFFGSANATKTLDSIVVLVNDSKYYSEGDYSSSDWFRDDKINDGVPALRKHFWVSNGISAQSDIKDYLELESNGYTLVS